MQQRHFREIAFQWLQSIAHAFDSQQQQQQQQQQNPNQPTSTPNEKCCSAQAITDSANASLTQFEKTYVSFPEFISNDEVSGWSHHHHHHHHHHDSLRSPTTTAWPQASSRSAPSSMAC